MSYEEVLNLAREFSDHQNRVQEIEPAILDAMQNTPEDSCVIEIGNQNGGSGALIQFHAKKRKFLTCDQSPCGWAINKYAVNHEHFQMLEADFVRKHLPQKIGFIYFDADHEAESVIADVRLTIPQLVKNAILAIDDVQEWKELPEFESLERVDYGVDQGKSLGVYGQHILFFRKR